jgi:hypothetical protein
MDVDAISDERRQSQKSTDVLLFAMLLAGLMQLARGWEMKDYTFGAEAISLLCDWLHIRCPQG